MSDSKTALIVGASRGIGNELAVQLSKQGWKVIATVRKPVEIPGAEVVQLDMNDDKSVEQAALKMPPIDLLVVNAAIGDAERVLTTTPERLLTYLDTNVVGPHRIVRAFLPALRRGNKKQIMLISSTSGSLEQMRGWIDVGFQGPYSVTKSALNMLALQLHNELSEQEGFTVVPLHPGWVATDMGNIAGEGAMPLSKSIEGITGVINGLSKEQSGRFVDYTGKQMPW